MAKATPQITMQSYGIYTHWDEKSKALPQIESFTTKVSAKLDIEFGYIINIKKAKGKKLHYCIYHPDIPDIPDSDGEVMSPFDGIEYVKDNNWDFYLGDTLWAPIENKTGDWRMTIELDGQTIADKTFSVELESQRNETDFWRARGYK